MGFIRDHFAHLDHVVGRSTFGRVFRLQGSGHEQEINKSFFTTEVRAGITTFFTMAYIIAVNASIISQTGGTCVCNDAKDPLCTKNDEYAQCALGVQRDLITATAAIAALSSFVFGFVTNLPVCLAPGMGLNAYFTYQVVGFHGSGPVSYRLALTAVFVEGFLFVFLSLIGMRQWLVKAIPSSLKIAGTAGIGFFLTLIGLSSSAGIGAVSGGAATPLDLAGCPAQFKDDFGACMSHKLHDPKMWIGIFCGGLITAWLMMYRVKSAMIMGIALVTIISWPRNTPVTVFPHTEIGDEQFDFFKKVVGFHPIEKILVAQDWNLSAAGAKFALALFTFLYVDIFDCTGTLYSMARFSGRVDPSTGDFPRSTLAYCTDAIMISIGALFGTSPVTCFVESGAGIAEGGKTGLTAMTTGLCFFISIFFAPIFASIPSWATGCTLIIVGWMMARSVVDINWKYAGDALPAFITLVFMPFSYSIAYGLIAGLMTYTVLNAMVWITKIVSRGRIVPEGEDQREVWNWKPRGGDYPWFMRLAKGDLRFWDEGTQGSRTQRGTHSPSSSMNALGEVPKTSGSQAGSIAIVEVHPDKMDHV